MANRMLPFGYCIQNGQIHVAEPEANVVQIIFQRYAEGLSYDKLAEELNRQDVPYAAGKRWNKNMVARILRNERYIGDPIYPQIVTLGAFRQARVAKPNVTGTTEYREITHIRRLARCGACLGPMRRERKDRWHCPHCTKSPTSIKDEHLIMCVDRLLHKLREQPDTAFPSPATATESGTAQTAQAEFDQELGKPEFDEAAATAKALALATAKFDALGSEDYETMRIRYLLANAGQHDGLDVDLLRQITAAILIHPSGAVGLRLKNGQTMERSDST